MTDALGSLIAKIIKREGGYTVDQGGPTNYGITIPFFTGITGRNATETDIRNLTQEAAVNIYRRYFQKLNISAINDESLLDLIFDFCVNAGEGRALKELQKAAGVNPDGQIGPVTLSAINSKGNRTVYYALLKQRFLFWAELASKNPERHLKSLPGWVNRGASFIKNI